MKRIFAGFALALTLMAGSTAVSLAQEAAGTTVPVQGVEDAAAPPTRANDKAHDPSRGAVTDLPLPRFVTLKSNEGNARRGPGLAHRIDWVFTRAGMPLKITAEFENWRRIEDAEGAGGWVHYSLLSGTRSVLVTEDMVEFHSSPQADAPVLVQAERGVVARLLKCDAVWCRISADGVRGWVRKQALWGVEADEIVD
jgi:SH3-like domain-containing protein